MICNDMSSFQGNYSVCPLFIFPSGIDPLFILPGNSSLSDSLSSPVLSNVPSRAPVSAPALTEAFHPHGACADPRKRQRSGTRGLAHSDAA